MSLGRLHSRRRQFSSPVKLAFEDRKEKALLLGVRVKYRVNLMQKLFI